MIKKVLYLVCALGLAILTGCARKSHEQINAQAAPEEPITGSASDVAVEFKTQWKPDRQYLFYYRQVQNIGSPKGSDTAGRKHKHGGNTDQERIFAEDYSLQVTNQPSDSHVQLAYQMQSLEIDLAYGDQFDYVFDSENKAVPPGNDAASTALSRLIGGQLSVDLSDNKLKKVSGRKSLTQQALDHLDANRTSGYVDRVLSDDTFKHLVEFIYLPDKAVSVGDSWKVKSAVTTGFSAAEANVNCTFKGWQIHEKRKCALFELEGTIASADPTDKSNLEDGHLTGRVWFDPELGMTAGAEIEQSATTSYKRKAGEMMTMPVSQAMSLMLVDAIQVEKKADAVN